jgi:hypothetical protein
MLTRLCSLGSKFGLGENESYESDASSQAVLLVGQLDKMVAIDTWIQLTRDTSSSYFYIFGSGT